MWTEALVSSVCPGRFYSAQDLFDAVDEGTEHLLQLLAVQSLAARQGVWLAREEEAEDAELALELFSRIERPNPGQFNALHACADELMRSNKNLEAAVCLIDADRIVRTTDGLFKASFALWRAGRFDAALWAIRTCLLERPDTFESTELMLKAQMIESSLRQIISQQVDIVVTPTPIVSIEIHPAAVENVSSEILVDAFYEGVTELATAASPLAV